MDNLNILVEAKREYLGQLCELMCPVMIENFEKMYEEAQTLSKGRKVLMMYQKLLKEVPNWSEAMSKQHSDNISNRCAWFNDLLAAVFVSCVKILSSVRLGKENRKISLKLPSNEVFIQTCYNNVAKDIYKDPYIFSESMNEHTRNDSLFQRFALAIEASVRELIPVQQILQTYMTQQRDDIDIGDAEVGDAEDPDFVEEDIHEPSSMNEPEESGPDDGVVAESDETPPLEEPEEEHVATDEKQQISPFDNEFKTINTAEKPRHQQHHEEEDEPVLFQDASDSPAKKVGYY